MCSIFGILDIKADSAPALRKQALEMSRKMRHRGPDWEGVYTSDKAILVHERLSIVDPNNGAQPLYNPEHTNVLAVNGEIYNHKEIKENFLDKINGIFAFILYDAEEDCYLIARDHIGIIPLYIGYDLAGRLYVASEMKALVECCETVKEFPAGSYLYSKNGNEIVKYYKREWMDFENVKDNKSDIDVLRQGLEDAVKRQLMCDVPYGVLLSGGLDSSVISAITKRFASNRIEDDGKSEAWW